MASNWRRARGSFTRGFRDLRHGIDLNLPAGAKLQNCAGNIATWADRYQPPPSESSPRLGRFPYLADDYALSERVVGKIPWDCGHSPLRHRVPMSFVHPARQSMR